MTAHLDLFVRNHLPPPELQPDFINLEFFSHPETLNCSDPLLEVSRKDYLDADGQDSIDQPYRRRELS